MIFFILQDKENGVSHNQQVPMKRGPKVNGVRRALVPQGGGKHKIGAMGENKDIIIPSQGEGISTYVPTPEMIKSANIGSNTPAGHQMQSPNVKVEPVSQGLNEGAARENGQPKRSGMTFVVDSSMYTLSLKDRHSFPFFNFCTIKLLFVTKWSILYWTKTAINLLLLLVHSL